MDCSRVLVQGPAVITNRLVENEPLLVLTVTISPGTMSVTWCSSLNLPPADMNIFYTITTRIEISNDCLSGAILRNKT